MKDTPKNRKLIAENFRPLIDKYGISIVKQHVRRCYLGRFADVPEDVLRIICNFTTKDPFEKLNLRLLGICPDKLETKRVTIDSWKKWNLVFKKHKLTIKKLTIRDIINFNEEIPYGIEELTLVNLPVFNQEIPGSVKKLSIINLTLFNQPIPPRVQVLILLNLPLFNQYISKTIPDLVINNCRSNTPQNFASPKFLN